MALGLAGRGSVAYPAIVRSAPGYAIPSNPTYRILIVQVFFTNPLKLVA